VDRLSREREVLSALRALSAADGLLNAAVAEAMGIHSTDLLAADVMERVGPVTVGELARTIHLSPGAATALVDRLEQAGLAFRRPDPASRRRVLVTPTGEGAARSEALFQPLVREASRLLASYRDEDLSLIKSFIAEATHLLADHAAVVRGEVAAHQGPGATGPPTPSER
jgi:DNA-binding MarR family transcriptional regulator